MEPCSAGSRSSRGLGRVSLRQGLCLSWSAGCALSAPPDERPASTVIDELTTPVLHVAQAGAQRSARSGHGRTGNTTDDSADRASYYCTSHNAGCRSCALLWGLARRGCEADHGSANELTHEILPEPRYGAAAH
jgi:hypothetical protein